MEGRMMDDGWVEVLMMKGGWMDGWMNGWMMDGRDDDG